VALNSASFNAGRMIGPALAGFLIAYTGSGWIFLINAASFAAVLGSLSLLRRDQLYLSDKLARTRGSLTEGFRYVQSRADLKAMLIMLFLVGAFGLNFPIYISTMSVKVFHVGSHEFGLLTSVMAIGSVTGALLAARRESPRLELLGIGAGLFGLGCCLAAIAPSYALFGVVLVMVGASAQTFTTSATGLAQLSTDRAVRGRVMAILLAVTLGGSFVGGPFVGWVADMAGPRWALGVGALAGLAAAAVALGYRLKYGASAGPRAA